MPSIQQQLALIGSDGLTSFNFEAIQPQNGNTPAQFREIDAVAPLSNLTLLNTSCKQDKLSGRAVFRSNHEIIIPVVDPDGSLSPVSNRVSINVRVDREVDGPGRQRIIELTRAFVATDVFADAVSGKTQY